MAQGYTAAALKTLASIMKASESDAARVAAANSLLDRGYGRAAQTIDAKITDDRMVVQAPTPAKDAGEWASQHGPH